MGNTQFMPSNVAAYGVDADKNGTLRATNWSKTDGSSVCPTEYRLPTVTELTDEILEETENSKIER